MDMGTLLSSALQVLLRLHPFSQALVWVCEWFCEMWPHVQIRGATAAVRTPEDSLPPLHSGGLPVTQTPGGLSSMATVFSSESVL